jgi:hypothetical protein
MKNNKNAKRTDRETLMRLTLTHTAGEREKRKRQTYSQTLRDKHTEI